ncbi:unnamed protein product, partial [Didymodactylos carnosus]
MTLDETSQRPTISIEQEVFEYNDVCESNENNCDGNQPYLTDIDSDGDCDDGSDDNEEELFSDDYENNLPLYDYSPLSLRNSAREIIRLARKLNLNKSGVKEVLNLLHKVLPKTNKLPRTLFGLLKVINIEPSKKVSYYCRECLYLLKSPQDTHCSRTCLLNDKPRLYIDVVEMIVNDVAKELKAVADRYESLISEYSADFDRLPYDIPNGAIFRQLPLTVSKFNHLTIVLQTDGAPLVKVGGKSLWPIQGIIVEIPPPLRDHNSAVMILGAWLGSIHPNRDLMWRGVVDQLKSLHRDGIKLQLIDGTVKPFSVRTQLILFDLPALASHANIKQFNGYDACPHCNYHGKLIGKEVFYPYVSERHEPKRHKHYLKFSTGTYPRT